MKKREKMQQIVDLLKELHPDLQELDSVFSKTDPDNSVYYFNTDEDADIEDSLSTIRYAIDDVRSALQEIETRFENYQDTLQDIKSIRDQYQQTIFSWRKEYDAVCEKIENIKELVLNVMNDEEETEADEASKVLKAILEKHPKFPVDDINIDYLVATIKEEQAQGNYNRNEFINRFLRLYPIWYLE